MQFSNSQVMMNDMEKEVFIRHLDSVYGAVSEKYRLCAEGKGSYNANQLKMILSELRSMKYWLNHRAFAPYYPRGIADDWQRDDLLGAKLMKLSDEYWKL